jgi:PAS domain S-box-containing protein
MTPEPTHMKASGPRPNRRRRLAAGAKRGLRPAEEIRRLKKLYALSMSLSGDPLEIFASIARMIADLFGVKTVCLSEICGDELRFLSVYENGKVTLHAGGCSLRVTPCATVAETRDIRVYDRVAERFPEASFLKARNAFSYCGFPSLDSEGNVVAVTCLLDPAPRDFGKEDRELLTIFGQRIAAEIERQRVLDEHDRASREIQKLSGVIEQSPAAILLTDTHGTIEYANQKLFDITGYTAEELIGRTPALFKSGMTPKETYENLWECLTAGCEWRGELLNRKKNGDLYWSRESISPIRDLQGDVTHFLAIEEDTTERRSIEEKLREVQKIDAIGGIAGGIAHDFNNLLTVVIGNLDLLLTDTQCGGGQKRLAETALRGALRAAELTRKLLAVSRKQQLQPELMDAKGLVSDLTAILRSALGERIELKMKIAPELWPVYADPVQVESALLNLAINARDAMPDGGAVTIELANVHFDPVAMAHYERADGGDYVMFAVTDTGTGMPLDVARRAFEPFFSTKEVGKGTGLGLSTVHGFAQQSGGFAELDSEPGKGTSVRFYLPRMAAPEETTG